MRRLARHLFTLSSAIFLLLCVAACVLWVRSYSVVDTFGRYRLGSGDPPSLQELSEVFTASSAIGYGCVRLDDPSKQRWPCANTPWRWTHHPRPPSIPHPRKWSWLGFATWDVRLPAGNGGCGVRGFQVPIWALTLLFGALPAPWLMRARRWRRAHRRRSRACAPRAATTSA